jgi:hypothetical protein
MAVMTHLRLVWFGKTVWVENPKFSRRFVGGSTHQSDTLGFLFWVPKSWVIPASRCVAAMLQ